MSQSVWVLSVDLQTKTATFQSGMADAAKAARGAFNDIKSGSGEMGGAVRTNMFEARHGVMLLGEEFGIKLPRALTAFITSIGPIGAAMEAAFPFLAIAVGATLLIEHLAELQRAGVKLTDDQVRFGTAVENAFNTLDQRLIQAKLKSDDLRNDHLGALRHELELINRQGMDELIHQFGEIAKTADVVFADLKTHWYSFSSGSDGAKRSLDEFNVQYAALIAKHDEAGASNLLHSKLARELEVLRLQKQVQDSLAGMKGSAGTDVSDEVKHDQAVNALKQMGAKYDADAITSEKALVKVLSDQVEMEKRVKDLKDQDSHNAKSSMDKSAAGRGSEAGRQAAEHAQRMGEIALGTEREQSQAMLDLKEASVSERLSADKRLADQEYKIQMEGNARLIAALDTWGPDYNNQLKAMHAKAEEITAQHVAAVASLTAKAQVSQYREDLQNLEQSERDKIDSQMAGSAGRLAALDSAIKEEQRRNLQNTSFYRELEKQRVQFLTEANAERDKLAADAGKEEAEHTQKMGELALAADKEKQALMDSSRRMTIQQRISEELQASQAELDLKRATLSQEAATLDRGAKDYQNKLKAIQDKEKQLIKQHENDVTTIKDNAEKERNQKILAAENQLTGALAGGLTQAIMGQKSFAAAMAAVGNEVESSLLQAALKHIAANLMTKESDAAKAARTGFNAGLQFPFPGNLVMAPLLGAGMYAQVMAFEGGTDRVPGIGNRDSVPAMLAPGEGVVPGGVMDGLRQMARSGNMAGGTHYHAHVNPTYNLQALDSTGMEAILNKHAPILAKHTAKELRKLNR